MTPATQDEIGELLGESVEETIVERIAAVGASMDEIGEAIDDFEYERRYGEARESSSTRVAEVRSILDELPAAEAPDDEAADDDLRVIEPDELEAESN